MQRQNTWFAREGLVFSSDDSSGPIVDLYNSSPFVRTIYWSSWALGAVLALVGAAILASYAGERDPGWTGLMFIFILTIGGVLLVMLINIFSAFLCVIAIAARWIVQTGAHQNSDLG